jgi:hypothetical protein
MFVDVCISILVSFNLITHSNMLTLFKKDMHKNMQFSWKQFFCEKKNLILISQLFETEIALSKDFSALSRISTVER